MILSSTRTSLACPSAPVAARRLAFLAFAAGGAACLVGCGGDVATNLTPPPLAGPDAYWSLELNHRAINLTTSGSTSTVQLAVTPRTLAGAALTGVTATPVYTVGDPAALAVTSDGLLTAKAPIPERTPVVARLTIGNVTHVDTAYVRVFDAAPPAPPSTMSIQPIPPDSAKWSLWPFGNKPIVPVVTAADGTPYENTFPFPLLVDFRSSNRAAAVYENGFIFNTGLAAISPGRTVITATTYAFGAALRDTVTYTIGQPAFQIIGIGEHPSATGPERVTYFSPDTITIGVNGFVVWQSVDEGTTDTVSVVFDDPAAAHPIPPPYDAWLGADSGNTAPIAPGTFFGPARQFTAPGTYRYHDAKHEASGVIRVVADTP